MRKISADYIFPVSSPPIKNGSVYVDDKGVILEVNSFLPTTEHEVYSGIIVPGFVNAHCHLELSHLKGKIGEHTGLPAFVSEIVSVRDKFSLEQIKSAMVDAEEEMMRNGIVAVGDISNTDHSFKQKENNKLQYHTFVEVYDLNEEKAKTVYDEAIQLQSSNTKLRTSITPHAPYSISGKLMELIDKSKQPLISIHNQETSSENELFISGTGALADLMKKFNIDLDAKRKTQKSLLYTLGRLIEQQKILLVHNTFTSKEDVNLIKYYAGEEQEIIFCLCPNANLYIENCLPDIPMFIQEGMKLTIGTDSYAANYSLSILNEMKTISKYFPQIRLDELLKWATINGAEIFGMEKEIGTIEKGKKPGLNLIRGIDTNTMKLSEEIEITKLI